MDPTEIKQGFYVTVEDYSRTTGISQATVKRRCTDGSLHATKVGRAWLIHVGRKFGS